MGCQTDIGKLMRSNLPQQDSKCVNERGIRMVTATKKRRTRVTKKAEIKEAVVVPTVVIESCFYCRESKYEPSTTRCPVSSHTQKRS